MKRRTAPAFVLLAALSAAACGDSSGPSVGPPSAIVAVMGNDQSGQAGAALGTPVTVRVNDAQGQGVAGVVVTFAVQDGGGAASPSQAQTDAQGQAQTAWTLGTQAGAEQRLTASFPRETGGTALVQFRATATAGPAVALVKTGGDNQHGGTAAALADSLAVRVTDQFGNGVAGITVTFTTSSGSVSPATRTTDAQGYARTRWTLGPTQGAVQAQASAGTLAGVSFTATAQPLAAITSVTPALLVPGGNVVISGINFPPDPAAIALTVAGTALTITSATATEIRATLPTAGFGCVPTGAAIVQLTAAGSTTSRTHPVQLVQQRALGVGQGLVSTTADRLDCIDLPQGGSRYVIAVTNTNPSVVSSLGFRLNSAGAAQPQASPAFAAAPAEAWVAPAALTPLNAAQSQALLRVQQRRAAHEQHHQQILRANAELVDNMRGAAPPRRAVAAAGAAGTAAVPEVGALLPMRVPRVDGSSASCNNFDEIQARVAYVGQRAIVLEDTANPVKGGALDTYYRQMGEEFDARQYEIIRDNFGDPLLRNSTLNNQGRVYMLFSRRVDGNRIAGFVFGGDFYPRTGASPSCAASNEAEIFYGYVPQNLSTNFQDDGSLAWWWWEIRSVVIHEVKHIASFASRIQQGVGPEESWLEEASAMVAEELWARAVYGYGRDNVGYAASIGCELRGLLLPSHPCFGRPGVMFSHFTNLANWMLTPAARSPLGSATTNDGSFYGSGWALLRHLVDHSGRPEAEILRELNQSTVSGAANVQARTGRPFADVVGDWALAMALDNRQGVPATGRWHMPGWNLRDVYAGLNSEQSGVMPMAWPLTESPLNFATSTQNVTGVRGGSTTYFELSTTTGAVPLALHVLGAGGGPLSNALRIQIFRVE